MRIAELKRRIARWEDLHTEFKQWPVQPDNLAAAMVAFANTDGGQLILGVAEDRTIKGVGNPDAAIRLVDNVALNNCEPPITVVQNVLKVSGKTVLVVSIPRGADRPYATKRGVFYVRTSSGRRRASQEELLRLFVATGTLFFDEMPVPRAAMKDLDLYALDRFLEASYGRTSDQFEMPFDRLLANLRLVKGKHPTLAGVLLFGRNPQSIFPYAQVNAARFPGRDLAEAPIDRKDITGRLADMLEGSLSFLNIHLRCEHRIKGFEPERFPELPAEALREVLVNAMLHRDYTIRGPIRLFVFHDRVEVHSPGKPPNTVDVEAMRLGTHVPRNPILLSHFAKMGYVTAVGSGIPRMIRLVLQATGREPELIIRPAEFVVVIPRPRSPRRARTPSRSPVGRTSRRQ